MIATKRVPARPAKPANLTHAVDDVPPPWLCLTLALQHVIVIAVGMTFPVLVGQAIGLSHHQTESFVRVSMLVAGIGTLLQSVRRGPIGSGYLCPEGPDPSFFPACVLAGSKGGPPLIFGMTAVAGAFEAVMAPVLYRLRALFPTEVTGVVVSMVGISVLPWAVASLLGVDTRHDPAGVLRPIHVAVGLAALAAMVGTNIWSKGSLRRYSILIGMGVGYAVAAAVGLLGRQQLQQVASAGLVALPTMPGLGWRFEGSLVLPFCIAIICSMLKNVGDITTCQKINDANWSRLEMRTVRGGILADATSTFLGGVLGGYGPASYSANVGLSVATGVTSRRVAHYAGAICILLACCPMLAAAFAIMPGPVLGAQLLFCICFMILAGLQITMSRMMDVRRTFVVGLSLAFGLSAGFLPAAFRGLPPFAQPVFASILSLGTVTAVLLNVLFRLGIARTASVEMELAPEAIQEAWTFLETQGARWGARVEVIRRATLAITEVIEQAIGICATSGSARLSARFDELSLDLEFEYEGAALEIPEEAPDLLDPSADVRAFGALAGYLVRMHADRVRTEHRDGRQRILLHFDH